MAQQLFVPRGHHQHDRRNVARNRQNDSSVRRPCLKRLDPELYDTTTAQPRLTVRMLTIEVVEPLLNACVTWILRAEYFAKLRTAHHQFLLRVVGFHRLLCTDHTSLCYEKVVKMTRSENIKTIIRKRCLVFAVDDGRQRKERLPNWVIFGLMASGGNTRPGRLAYMHGQRP